MSVATIFNVKFQVVKASAAGKNTAYDYRRESRQALVQAASIHPKDILNVLNADIPTLAGENIEIIHASQVSGGSEGVGLVLT